MKVKFDSYLHFFVAEKVVLLQTIDKQGYVLWCKEHMIPISFLLSC